MSASVVRAGFARVDITPPIGIELCGFGPYLRRRSQAVRDRLWARAFAVEAGGERAVIVSCDLIGAARWMVERARVLVTMEVNHEEQKWLAEQAIRERETAIKEGELALKKEDVAFQRI